jgi:hypothetical protein
MAMIPAVTVAQSIVASLGVPPAGQAAAVAAWTSIVAQIQTMVVSGTVTVTGTATGAMGGGAGVPVVGTGTIA